MSISYEAHKKNEHMLCKTPVPVCDHRDTFMSQPQISKDSATNLQPLYVSHIDWNTHSSTHKINHNLASLLCPPITSNGLNLAATPPSKYTSWQSSTPTPLANCTTTKSMAVPSSPSATMGACHVPAP